jgi:hypothetical protein
MKRLLLSIALCLTAFSFVKAQETSLAVSEQTFPIATQIKATPSFEGYCGVYKMQENPYIDKVQIILKDGQLMSKSPEDEEIVFEHTENSEFFIPAFNARAIFTAINGVIKSVKVIVQGKELTGEKL